MLTDNIKIVLDNSKVRNSTLNENQYNYRQIKIRITRCRSLIKELSIDDINGINKISQLLDEISSMIHNYEEIESGSKENKNSNRRFILNDEYRTLQNLYVTALSKISVDKIEKIRDESEKSIKDISNNMIINIAAIFLGISLVSAMVQGIDKIPSNMLLIYFMGNGAIILSVLGVSAIFFRTIDKKSLAIFSICAIYLVAFVLIILKFLN